MAASGGRVSSSGSPCTPLSAYCNRVCSTRDIDTFGHSVVPMSRNAGELSVPLGADSEQPCSHQSCANDPLAFLRVTTRTCTTDSLDSSLCGLLAKYRRQTIQLLHRVGISAVLWHWRTSCSFSSRMEVFSFFKYPGGHFAQFWREADRSSPRAEIVISEEFQHHVRLQSLRGWFRSDGMPSTQ